MRDYEELVEQLRSVKDDTWQTAEEQWMLDAADAIEELQQNIEQYKLYLQDAINDLRSAHEKEQKWISVEEQLPIRGDRVVCFGDNGINLVDFVCGDKWCALPWFYLDGEQETGVTHWMPLPEPPKEET